MPFWKLTYTGDLRWNIDREKIVIAPTADEALAWASWFKQPKETWTAEEVKDEGQTDTILGNWVGDQH